MRPHQTTIRSTPAGLLISLCCLLGPAWALGADVIELRATATVGGDAVTLDDVAYLSGEAARALADLELTRFENRDKLTLTAPAIRRALSDRGVHWGRVNLRGPRQVRVSRQANSTTSANASHTDPTEAADAATGPATAQANPVGQLQNASTRPNTVRAFVRRWVEQATGAAGGDLRIDYDDKDGEVWSMSDTGRRFELEPDATNTLGRIPMTLRVYRDNRPVATERLVVDVAVRRRVAVASTTLHRGQIITRGDVASTEHWIDSSRIDPVADAAALVGQQTARLVRPGQIIEPADVQSPVVVKRGELITVRALSGGLVIRTVARAQDAGAVGDVIVVRNVRTREQFHVEVCGPQEAVLAVDARSDHDPSNAQPGGDA